MQYSSYNSGVHYTPVVGVVPQETQNFTPNGMFGGNGYTVHPSYFGDYAVPTPNHFLHNTPVTFSRQATMVNPRMNTSMMTPFSPGFMPPLSTKPPGLFRRRNSTNPVRNTNRARAFRRSNSSATNHTKVFVPKVYTTDIYPFRVPVVNKSTQKNDMKQAFGSPFSNASTIVSSNDTSNQINSYRSNVLSDLSSIPMRPRKAKRNPNFEKSSPFDKAFKTLKRDFELPKIDPKDAVQFFEGLVLAALGILRVIVRELRSDIIAGLFASDDPDYDAARSYYYTNLKQKVRNSGFTERIDYIEAIENENRTRVVERKESVRVESMREFANITKKDFMEMTEREFEEFLLRQAYAEASPFAPKM